MIIMIKRNDQSESKQIRMDSWFSNYFQETSKQNQKTKINQQTIIKNKRKRKNSRKVKAMGNTTSTMNHYSTNGQMRDTDP